MAAAFLTFMFLATGTIVFAGFVICAEYRWVTRLEYLARLDSRDWELYWPIVVPASDPGPDLY